MRDRRRPLCTRLAEEQGAGAASDRASCRELWSERRQEASPGPADAASWARRPAVDAQGDPGKEESSRETKRDPRGASPSPRSGLEALPRWQAAVRRNSASAAAQSNPAGLPSAPAGERSAGLARGVGEALGTDWPRAVLRPPGGHRGWSLGREPRGSGLLGWQRGSAEGVSEFDPPRALLEKLDSALALSCLRSIPLHAHPLIFLNDETKSAFPGRSEPMFSEPRVEYKKIISWEKSTSDDLQITVASLAAQAFE
ncbi:protein FAM220A [Budorcas taxicolor]|uniref:protein FAM220A n=1 Tax=Budorcas taxicolor TaxID=37181 RepID=UPI002284CB9A|nr:protein FAM220A [Budorcas taxicolor]